MENSEQISNDGGKVAVDFEEEESEIFDVNKTLEKSEVDDYETPSYLAKPESESPTILQVDENKEMEEQAEPNAIEEKSETENKQESNSEEENDGVEEENKVSEENVGNNNLVLKLSM